MGIGAVRPLAGLRVLSLAEQYPGPYAGLLLGDLGADVVQVERPDGGDPARRFPQLHAALNRGKRSICLDLKSQQGAAACRRLAATSDVLLEGFRPGVVDRLGLSAAALAAEHPALVYVSVSGFGQSGPYAHRPAHDLSLQALAGLLGGSPGQSEQLPHLSLADVAAGLFTALAALAGVAGRAATGRGGHYDVAMFDSLVSFMTTALVPAANSGAVENIGLDPGYGVFATCDGRWLSVSIAFEDHFWQALCAAAGLQQHAHLDASARRVRLQELRSDLAGQLARHDLEHWERTLGQAGVPFGALNDLPRLLADPHLQARGLLQTVDTDDGPRRYLRQPILVDGTAPGPLSATPALGEHTRAVLSAAGLPDSDIVRLLASGTAVQAAPALRGVPA